MGCGASNDASGSKAQDDKGSTEPQEESQKTKMAADEDFDGGVAPADKSHQEADHSKSATDDNQDASANAPSNELEGFTFGESNHEHGGFVAFGGGGGAFGGGDGDGNDDADAPVKAKPRRIAVSDECADAGDEDWTAPVVPKSDDDRALIATVLKRNPLLQNLDAGDVDVVVNAMERQDFAAGSRVLEQGGDGGTHYYVIAAGQVEIIKNNQLICTFSEGQGFGEMELLYVQPVVATVRCRVDTRTWALDRKTYKRTVMRLALERRKLYSELLSNVDFLENMTDYERQTLADALSPVTLAPGESLIRRGEVNEWMYIIIDGVVEVLGAARPSTADTGIAAGAPLTHVTDLEKGSCVGELEFLNQHPAVADCVAKTQVRACKLHRDHFELCMGPVTDVLRRTVRQDKYQYYQEQLQGIFEASAELNSAAGGSSGPSPSKRRRHRHAVSAEADTADADADWAPPVIEKSPEALEQAQAAIQRCPLFSALSGEDSKVVVDALQPVHFEAGARIISEGSVPDEAYWYIISAGSVVLKQSADAPDAPERELALLTEGQSFGELDLMYSTPSVVSAVALADDTGIDCFRLDRRTYRKIIMQVTVERRRLYRELLTGVPFLAQLSEPQQLSLADALSPSSFTSGELLCRHGYVNEWMYIIVDGVVEVFAADGSKVCDLRRGEMVGELEFFNKHKCVANCVAKTHVTTCRLHRDHFEGCMGPVSGFIDEILKTEKYAYYKAAEKQTVA